MTVTYCSHADFSYTTCLELAQLCDLTVYTTSGARVDDGIRHRPIDEVIVNGSEHDAFITVLGFTAGGSLVFYTFTTYMQKYLVNTVGMSISDSTTISAATLFLFMCLQPVIGGLSDKIGRRPILIVSLLGLALSVNLPVANDG